MASAMAIAPALPIGLPLKSTVTRDLVCLMISIREASSNTPIGSKKKNASVGLEWSSDRMQLRHVAHQARIAYGG